MNVETVAGRSMADCKFRISGRSMITDVKHTVKGLINTVHHIVGMTALSTDQGHIVRHSQRINIGGISMSVPYHNLIGTRFTGCFTGCQHFLCHLFCKCLIYRFCFMRLTGQCQTCTSLDISTYEQLHVCFSSNFFFLPEHLPEISHSPPPIASFIRIFPSPPLQISVFAV